MKFLLLPTRGILLHLFLVVTGVLYIFPIDLAAQDKKDWKNNFVSRIEENKIARGSARRLSENGQSALSAVIDRCQELDRMVTAREVMQVLSQLSNPISKKDFFGILSVVKRVQKSDISKKELLAVLHDWDSIIKSADVVYEIKYSGGHRDQLKQLNRFAVDGNKLYWNQQDISAPPSYSVRREVQSYDGISYIDAKTYGQNNIDNWERSRNVIAVVKPLDTRWRFLHNLNPLVAQKVLDVNKRFDVPGESYEPIAEFLNRAEIYETEKVIGGNKCICLASEYSYWFLCPDLGYAIVSLGQHEYAYDEKSGRVIKTGNSIQQIAENFVLASDSVWLPRKITTTVQNGNHIEIKEVSILDIKINAKIPTELFTDVVPAGALVSDPKNPVARRVAGDKSPQ